MTDAKSHADLRGSVSLINGMGFDGEMKRNLIELVTISYDAGYQAGKNDALLAQRIEHEPSKLGVEGSNPSERAIPSPKGEA